MRDGILIGIDAGTSVIKSVAFTVTGEQVAAAAIPNRYLTFPDGGAEQDMARTWTDAAATLRELTQKIPNLAERLIAISVTGQGDGMWLIDKEGEPVGRQRVFQVSKRSRLSRSMTSRCLSPPAPEFPAYPPSIHFVWVFASAGIG